MSFLTNTFFVSKNVESEVKFQAHSQSQVAKESKSLNCQIESQSNVYVSSHNLNEKS